MSTQTFLTLAYMSAHLSRPYSRVVSAIAELKITPALVLNELVYFSAADEARIYDYLQTKDEK
ncbi:MAG: hypothetical protein WCB27_13665 [Thermoguttaceae bacterium]